eukprot:3941958-Rhodomonas_salina.1
MVLPGSPYVMPPGSVLLGYATLCSYSMLLRAYSKEYAATTCSYAMLLRYAPTRLCSYSMLIIYAAMRYYCMLLLAQPPYGTTGCTRMLLHPPYAMCSTELAYGATSSYAASSYPGATADTYAATLFCYCMLLHPRYATCGTELAYAAMIMRAPYLPTLSSYAHVCGTELAYAATPSLRSGQYQVFVAPYAGSVPRFAYA